MRSRLGFLTSGESQSSAMGLNALFVTPFRVGRLGFPSADKRSPPCGVTRSLLKRSTSAAALERARHSGPSKTPPWRTFSSGQGTRRRPPPKAIVQPVARPPFAVQDDAAVDGRGSGVLSVQLDGRSNRPGRGRAVECVFHRPIAVHGQGGFCSGRGKIALDLQPGGKDRAGRSRRRDTDSRPRRRPDG